MLKAASLYNFLASYSTPVGLMEVIINPLDDLGPGGVYWKEERAP